MISLAVRVLATAALSGVAALPAQTPTGTGAEERRPVPFETGEPRGDDARMLELLEPYRGQRARVVRLIERAGVTAPKYGPRLSAQRIEDI